METINQKYPLSSLTAKERAVLRQAALCIYADKRTCAGRKDFGGYAKSLLKKGLLTRRSDGVWFSSSGIFVTILANAIVKEEGLARASAETIQQRLDVAVSEGLDYRAIGEYRALAVALLICLVNEYGNEVLPEVLLSNREETRWRSFYEVVCDALPLLRLSPLRVIRLLNLVIEHTKNDLAPGEMFISLRQLARLKPRIARAIIGQILTTQERLIPALGYLMEGLALSSSGGLRAAKQLLRQWRSAEDPNLRSIVPILYSTMVREGRVSVRHTLSVFESLVGNEGIEVRRGLIRALAEVAKSKTEARARCLGILRYLLVDERPSVRQTISGALAYIISDPRDPEIGLFHREALPYFYSTTGDQLATIDSLETILTHWIKEEPQFAANFLQQWILHHDDPLPINHSQRFLSAVNEFLRRCPDRLEQILVDWLLSDEAKLRSEACNLINYELEIGGKFRSFRTETISRLTEIQLMVLAIELFVGLGGEETFYLVADLANYAESKNRFVKQLVELLKHLATNYLPIAENVLKPLTKSESKTTRKIAREVLRHYREYLKARKDCHRIKELHPPESRWWRFSTLWNQRMRAAMEAGPQDDPGRFIGLKLFPKSLLAAGGAFFFKREGRFSEPMPLKKFEAPLLLPRHEIADPDGEMWRRHQLAIFVQQLREELRKNEVNHP